MKSEEGNDMNNMKKTDISVKGNGELVKELVESLANELYIEPEEVDMELSFMEMGLDSIIGVEWIRSINKKYGCTISTTKIYQYPNILEFAKYMEGELGLDTEALEEQDIPVVQKMENTLPQDTNENELIAELIESLANELYLEPEEIDVEAGFTEMGLDSIIGVEWVRSINKKYGCAVSTTKIYQYPNILEFAKYLKDELHPQTKEQDIADHSSMPGETDCNSEKISQKQEKIGALDTIDAKELMDGLIESLAEELYMEPEEINVDASFTEMGLDSIIAVEWVRSINKKYNISINTTKIYQYPDLTSFSKYVLKTLADSCVKNNDESGSKKDLDDLLWQVYQGEVDVDDAKGFLNSK